MQVRNVVKRNFHRDSMQLLQLSERAKKLEGVLDAAVVMGTSTNKGLLEKLELLDTAGRAATEADLIIAVATEREETIGNAVEAIERLLLQPERRKTAEVYSIESALQTLPDANLAIVSVPGEHAAGITRSLLEKGIHVHLFSDHIPVKDEADLKRFAVERGLLVLGPGAGTSLIAGRAVAFANVVRRGGVGIVAAAGTGLQEISVLLDQVGLGVSQGLGVGGGDVKAAVGGLMMIQSIDALNSDPETSVIVIVSKPPDLDVHQKIMRHIAEHTRKPVVANFVGADSHTIPSGKAPTIAAARTLHSAVLEAVRVAAPASVPDAKRRLSLELSEIMRLTKSCRLLSEQRFVRGLYTGGTLAYEALVLLRELCGDIWSNAPLEGRLKLPDSDKSHEHSIIDLGEEEYTAGRAHPMIDPTIRKLRLIEEAQDSEVAVIVMDFMLGYGSNPDPAGIMIDSITRAKQIAKATERELPMFAHVCGTEADPQVLSSQIQKLESAGVRVFATNATMVVAAAAVAARDTIKPEQVKRVLEELLG